jgi:hypothetical protein
MRKRRATIMPQVTGRLVASTPVDWADAAGLLLRAGHESGDRYLRGGAEA